MLRLVNQILDFRKIQNKKMKMQVQRVDVVLFVRKVMDNFEAVAEEHRIDFLFETEKEHLYLWVDADKLEKIVFNLLSNAFKYTPNGKMITIFIREDEEIVSIGVQDQGIGIAENKKKSLFVRFENLVDKNLFNQASTGIGLSLVKELVEMHQATISVDSRLGEGSCFKVDFLKGKEHYDKEVEFILEDTDAPMEMGQVVDLANSSIQSERLVADAEEVGTASSVVEEQETEEGNAKELMLLVEDNQELRVFLRSIFASNYRVVEAADGMEGWSKALKYVPDIIISDVMMPEKNGIEMTRELRADMTTSHIPIILLTAKTTIESKLEGLEYGADDYITKPFNILEVKARIKAILRRMEPKKTPAESGGILESGDLKLDRDGRRAYIQRKEIGLTAKEFEVLELLMLNPDKVYSRENLLKLVWGTDYPGDVRTVDVHIRRLREKIELSPSEPRYVHTKWGVGYYFNDKLSHGQNA